MFQDDYIEPTAIKRQWMYKFYELAYESDFELAKKRSLMTAAMGYEKWGWRVVGITKKAIIEIAINDFNLPKGLQRDHQKQPRSVTFNKIFSEKKYNIDDWWSFVWENDETILMTKDEHLKHKKKDEIDYYCVDYTKGFFRNKAVVGMHFSKKIDGKFVKELFVKNNLIIKES